MATRKRSKHEEAAVIWRAVAGWVRHMPPGQRFPPFDTVEAELVEIRGKSYVKLSSGGKVLAVFRVRVDLALRKMRRPPRELRGEDE